MSHRNPRSHNIIYLGEKHVLELEANCQKRFAKRTQSGHKIGKSNISLRKCRSAHSPSKRTRRRRRRRVLATQSLKIPRLPDKIVNYLNILHQENFPKVVDQYFKITAKNEPQKQPRLQQRKWVRVKTKTPVCKPGVPTQAELKL